MEIQSLKHIGLMWIGQGSLSLVVRKAGIKKGGSLTGAALPETPRMGVTRYASEVPRGDASDEACGGLSP